MELQKTVNMYVLGQLLADDLPTAAVQALEDGFDSPALCQLAGGGGGDSQETRALFLKALDELKVPVPSPREAALSYAREVAGDVLNGAIAPYEGARKIWGEVYTRFPELKELTLFVGLASEYEDDEKHRDSYARQIVEECKALLGK